jgi:hypothetical protein
MRSSVIALACILIGSAIGLVLGGFAGSVLCAIVGAVVGGVITYRGAPKENA